MALFKRKQRDDGPPDAHLTFMTQQEADQVRALVREAFAERGVEVVIHADHVAAGTTQYGLWNVAATCRELPNANWRAAVGEHVDRLVRAQAQQEAVVTMSAAEVTARVYTRLYEAASLPAEVPHLEFAGGVAEILSVDLGDTVALLRRDRVDECGGWPALQRAGRENLRRLPLPPHRRADVGNGGHLSCFASDSFYTASLALLLPDVLTSLGDPPGDNGVLLTIPSRQSSGGTSSMTRAWCRRSRRS